MSRLDVADGLPTVGGQVTLVCPLLAYFVEKLLKTWATPIFGGHKPSPTRVAFNGGRSTRSIFCAVTLLLGEMSFSTVSAEVVQ